MKKALALILALVLVSTAGFAVAQDAPEGETVSYVYRLVPVHNLFQLSAEDWVGSLSNLYLLPALFAHEIDELFNPDTVDVLNTETSYVKVEEGEIKVILPGTTNHFYVEYQPNGYAAVVSLEAGYTIEDALTNFFYQTSGEFYEISNKEVISIVLANVPPPFEQLGDSLSPVSERAELVSEIKKAE